ncbi:MAG: Ferredoxin [Candidatus Methanohalarchaeum thermophilum]|uniref:Ferredoxin n=1 Tax=Methanohalarchaeum thermophilum TaxID=1903181 RepID=A0A1Q6DW50_METT1|nr:MAG: Ferredoxin [Candidatus Methanohalarchaeum thermophilum]
MIEVDSEMCGHCGACVGVCPENALDLVGYNIKVVGECISCGNCEEVCPVNAITRD